MKLLNIEGTRHGISVTILGRRIFPLRRSRDKKIAARIALEGAPAVCLSLLYAQQGWFQELHRDVAGVGAPSFRRHGGRGRAPSLADEELDTAAFDFANFLAPEKGVEQQGEEKEPCV